jgi:hypothetical protein
MNAKKKFGLMNKWVRLDRRAGIHRTNFAKRLNEQIIHVLHPDIRFIKVNIRRLTNEQRPQFPALERKDLVYQTEFKCRLSV